MYLFKKLVEVTIPTNNNWKEKKIAWMLNKIIIYTGDFKLAIGIRFEVFRTNR